MWGSSFRNRQRRSSLKWALWQSDSRWLWSGTNSAEFCACGACHHVVADAIVNEDEFDVEGRNRALGWHFREHLGRSEVPKSHPVRRHFVIFAKVVAGVLVEAEEGLGSFSRHICVLRLPPNRKTMCPRRKLRGQRGCVLPPRGWQQFAQISRMSSKSSSKTLSGCVLRPRRGQQFAQISRRSSKSSSKTFWLTSISWEAISTMRKLLQKQRITESRWRPTSNRKRRWSRRHHPNASQRRRNRPFPICQPRLCGSHNLRGHRRGL